MSVSSTERLTIAARGGEVDRKPVIAWPGKPEGDVDAVVCEYADLRRLLGEAGDDDKPAVLVQVSNPFGRALTSGQNLNALLADEPEVGGSILDGFVSETQNALTAAIEGGADGVVYVLHGACEQHCSPMQYGGHYLERDRELLEGIADARLNLLYVVGDQDLYLDFVSDLPAHLFGWDNRTTGISAAEGRAIRGGAVATFDSGSDVLLTSPGISAAQILEKNCRESLI